MTNVVFINVISSFNTASGKCCCNRKRNRSDKKKQSRFNTASGKCCCNKAEHRHMEFIEGFVSIPQAVSAVATGTEEQGKDLFMNVSIPQAVSAVATH